ncbi:Mu transposase C-terminal domain-containing protein [Roseobacteraceae bacterium NS-SX3]
MIASIPQTKRNINALAKREGWKDLGPGKARKRTGRGGGWEYHVSCLPAEAQREYERRAGAAARAGDASRELQKAKAGQLISAQSLDARRRQVMEARMAVLLEIDRRAAVNGTRLCRTIQELLGEARAGLCDARMAELLAKASDRPRSPVPSERTIHRWRKAYYQTAAEGGGHTALSLVPETRRVKQDFDVLYPWFPEFLRHYAIPAKVSMAHALENYSGTLDNPADAPSYDQVRRAMKALQGTDNHLLAHKGREGHLAIKARLMFKRRTLEGMEPTVIYSADGKTFDAEIAHPLHGRPFKPEITTVIDIVTRKIVGWSVDLAENTLTVTDALRHACVSHGVPAIFYTDRGPGYKNATVEGLCARLSITLTHSLPYNSQARGAIERVNGSVWNKAAKEFVTYLGADMDREAAQRVHKRTRRDLKEFGTSALLPSFEEFLAVVEARVAAYNDASHESLRVRDPITGRVRRGSPNEAWAEFASNGFDHFPVSDAEADDLFRPYVKRRCRRGEVEWIRNQYMHPALEPFHGQDVLVGYDIHDASKVWVRELDQVAGETQPGRLICVADFWHNKERYVPVTFEQHAREQRVKGQLRRLGAKQERAEADLRAPMLLDNAPEVPLAPAGSPQSELAERSAPVVELAPVAAQAPRRDPRNPWNDPDIELAWQIVDAPAGTPIPPHHVGLLWDLLGNVAAVSMMKDVELPLAVLQARLRAADQPLKSSIGG